MTEQQTTLPFFTLLLLISFASVNAVMFTPALPDIANYFDISHDSAQLTISWFLIGYAAGQLVYGPLANRFGRKPAIYAGICLQIISSLICVLSGVFHEYSLLVVGRLLLALGSGVGLKMTFTLVNECYAPRPASKLISYLILAFAITPGLAAAIGGVLTQHLGWTSCFYAGAIYGLILLGLSRKLPETQLTPDYNALKWSHLIHAYGVKFKNTRLVTSAMMMSTSTCFVYTFAAIAPFVAINLLGMSSSDYGFANIIPAIGLIIGSLTSAKLTDRFEYLTLIFAGTVLATIGVVIMLIAVCLHASAIHSIFIPMMIIYLGLAAVLPNASAIAMGAVQDKAHGSAVMNFINMGLATVVVMGLGFLPMSPYLMPILYLILCAVMFTFYKLTQRTPETIS